MTTAKAPAPPRVDVFGTAVSLTTVEEVTNRLIDPDTGSYVVAVANVHSVMSARRDPNLASALREADVVTPDGVPLGWAMKASGYRNVERVTGIDIMTRSFDAGRQRNTRHFLYGSTPEVLNLIRTRAEERFPGVAIVGAISPPFRELTDVELEEHIRRIHDSGADVVWIGLGMPKQEMWMWKANHRLPGMSLIGVGAAFDWFAGTVSMAPQWMRRNGLEWLYRLLLNPKAMWRRYYYNNPAFLALLGGRWLKRVLRLLSGREDGSIETPASISESQP